MTSGLIRNHPEQIEAVCLICIDCQNLLINPFSLSKSAALVVPKSIPQHLLNDRGRLLPQSSILFREGILMAIHRLNQRNGCWECPIDHSPFFAAGKLALLSGCPAQLEQREKRRGLQDSQSNLRSTAAHKVRGYYRPIRDLRGTV
jgi:hypothetical protein